MEYSDKEHLSGFFFFFMSDQVSLMTIFIVYLLTLHVGNTQQIVVNIPLCHIFGTKYKNMKGSLSSVCEVHVQSEVCTV